LPCYRHPSHPYSPPTRRSSDLVYITWTEFAADGSAYIYETHSDDYGETFSPRVLVSADNGMCPVTYGAGTDNGDCNENQFSDPLDRKSTRLNSSHQIISYAVIC